MALHIAVIHGPNLNLLGVREPERYGTATLNDVQSQLDSLATELGAVLCHFQSNSEGALVDWLQAKRGAVDGCLVNAGGYTHTSVALRDALLACEVPFVEVHVTNPHAREPFRHHSYLSDIAAGVVCGFGAHSYTLALRGLFAVLTVRKERGSATSGSLG